jgi:hypothetical protein
MPVAQLVGSLSGAWQPGHYLLAQELAHRWKTRLKTEVEIKAQDENAVRFVTDLSEIRLRGMNEVPCLMLSGGEKVLRDFWQKSAGAGKLPFILALSEKAYEQAKAEVAEARGLALSAEMIRQILDASDSRETLKRILREQIPRQRLVPYEFLLSAEGGMFFGRGHELDRLRYNDNSSFAVVGPSKIGKTSLIRQYRYLMARNRGASSSARIYIDFYNCHDTTGDGVARFFAAKIESSQRSNRMTGSGLVDFLRYQQGLHKGPLDLLLDEVDEVCHSEAFEYLGEAAKLGYCRLALCGKGSLLKLMSTKKSPLEGRLELIRLEPLDPQAARKLILQPLADLGFQISEPDQLVERIFRLTGRIPHLIQLVCKQLATSAIEEGAETISVDRFEAVKWDFAIASVFTNPLRHLANSASPESYLLALMILRDGRREFPVQAIRALAAKQDLELDSLRTEELCNDLFINNILSWNQGKYCLANEGLKFYLSERGMLTDTALDEARRALRDPLNANHKTEIW